MKVVLPGGTGQIGALLARAFMSEGHEVVVLSRSGKSAALLVTWDGKTVEDAWAKEIDGADVVINLAGRTVNCRYTAAHLKEMMDSRIDSTRAVGAAIAAAAHPPRVWLQMSTATIYAHRFDAPNDEATGVIGGAEPDVPAYWGTSIAIAKSWERVLEEAPTPGTRRVALRSAVVMSPSSGGAFSILWGMTKLRLGGAIGGGTQFVSWIHEDDFVAAVKTIVAREDLSGAINLAAPNPLPQRDFMKALRAAGGIRVGLPATKWMAEIGAFFLRTDTELLLKSRRVIPGRLLASGFTFRFPDWPSAAKDLVVRSA